MNNPNPKKSTPLTPAILDEILKGCKKVFPKYPFKSELKMADEMMYFTPDQTDLQVIMRAGGGIRLPLTEEELKIIDDIVGSREILIIKAFLTTKCNVQNVKDLSWTEILGHLKVFLFDNNKNMR